MPIIPKPCFNCESYFLKRDNSYICKCGSMFCNNCLIYKKIDQHSIHECSYCTITPDKIKVSINEKYIYLLKKFNLTDSEIEELVKNNIINTGKR